MLNSCRWTVSAVRGRRLWPHTSKPVIHTMRILRTYPRSSEMVVMIQCGPMNCGCCCGWNRGCRHCCPSSPRCTTSLSASTLHTHAPKQMHRPRFGVARAYPFRGTRTRDISALHTVLHMRAGPNFGLSLSVVDHDRTSRELSRQAASAAGVPARHRLFVARTLILTTEPCGCNRNRLTCRSNIGPGTMTSALRFGHWWIRRK